MSNGEVTFGWVIQPTPKGFSEDAMADPHKAARALVEANEQHIQAMQPQFDTVWVEDHFQWSKRPVVEAVSTLSYLAGKFDTPKFGHLVLGQSYRQAALTAKMAANLQLLTGGRFILGIGAGWKEDEYRAYGFPYPPASQRIAELQDAVQIIRALWTESPATYHGKCYSIEEAECQPQPDPPIPLLIAGGGEQKTLRVVARYADWWNYNFCDAAKYAHKLGVLRRRCEEIGRDPGEIKLTYYGFFSVVDEPSKLRPPGDPDIHVIGGTPEMVVDELLQFVKLGVTHFQCRFLDFPSLDGMQMFIDRVVPALAG